MIWLYRKHPQPNANIASLLKKLDDDAKKFYSDPVEKRRQLKYEFDQRARFVPKLELHKTFDGKCMYCESIVSITESEIDWFRPPKFAKDMMGKEISEDHYWWLSNEWRNLYLSCPACARAKQSFFPVLGKRCEIGASYEDALKEKNLLIDPFHDKPEDHFFYNDAGVMFAKSDRGRITIEILNLNRQSLIEGRRKELFRFDKTGITNSTRPFLGATRWAAKENLPRGRTSKIKPTRTPEFAPSSLKRIIIKSVEIKNFKSIKHIKIEMPTEVTDGNSESNNSEQWMMLLGENGVGKSSFLQAVTLCLAGQRYIDDNKFSGESLTNHAAANGYIKIAISGGEDISMNFSKKGKIKSSIKVPPTYLLGYGSTRLPEFGTLKAEIIRGDVRAMNLFRYDVALLQSNKFLLDLFKKSKTSKEQKKLFDWAARAILDLLLLTKKERLTVVKGKVMIQYSKHRSETLEEQSDGYKSMIALSTDIIQTLIRGKSHVETANGVVIIDEIGTHLHPRWRMQVVGRLRTVFKNLQFICTTHDPLCLRGLRKNEVVVFEKNSRHEVKRRVDIPDHTGLSAEQILGSEFFGLNSTYDPTTEENMSEYYRLLGKKSLTTKETTKKKDLEIYAKKIESVGASTYDQLLHVTVSKQVAEYKTDPLKRKADLEAETISKIEKLLKA